MSFLDIKPRINSKLIRSEPHERTAKNNKRNQRNHKGKRLLQRFFSGTTLCCPRKTSNQTTNPSTATSRNPKFSRQQTLNPGQFRIWGKARHDGGKIIKPTDSTYTAMPEPFQSSLLAILCLTFQ